MEIINQLKTTVGDEIMLAFIKIIGPYEFDHSVKINAENYYPLLFRIVWVTILLQFA